MTNRRYERGLALVLLLWLVCCFKANAQVAVTPAPSPGLQFLDVNGKPLAGGKVCTFSAGTLNPLTTYSESTGSSANTNPITLDSGGFANIFLTSAAYKFIIYSSVGADSNCPNAGVQQRSVDGIDPRTLTSSAVTGTLSVSGAVTLSSTLSVGGASTMAGITDSVGITSPSVNGALSIDGVHYARTDAGIQAAVNAVSDGGEIYLPLGTYVISGTITIAKRITIRGAGWGTLLQVAAGVGATTDVFLLKPATASDVQGMRFQDFYIAPISGAPARYGFNIDGTNASIAYAKFDHVRVDTLGNYPLAVTNASGLVNGSPYTTSINDCLFSGGMNLDFAGDSITIQSSTFPAGGGRGILVNQVGAASTNGGAHGFSMHHNNITVTGGVIIKNAWQGVFAYNDMELAAISTEANNALLDIQGNASANVQNFKVIGNYLGGNNAFVADTVRIDQATATEIFENFTAQGSGVSYRVTANAVRTHISWNRNAPDNPVSSYLADLGTATTLEFVQQSTGIRTFVGTLGFSSAAGTTGVALTNAQVKVNPTNGAFCSSTGDPSSTSCDTFLSRVLANEWGFGTAFGLTDGIIDVRNIKVTGSSSGVDTIQAPAVAGAGTFLLAAGTAGATIPASFTTTAATTDNVTVTGMTASGHCILEPTNTAAAAGIASVFVSAKAANQITVTHTATSGWTFDILCTPN